jgi:hypothetical protein
MEKWRAPSNQACIFTHDFEMSPLTSASISMFDLAGHGLKIWFWDQVRKSEPLKRLIERVTAGKSADQLYQCALRECIDFTARFFKEKRILGECKVNFISGMARFLVADQAEVLNGLQNIATPFLPDVIRQTPIFETLLEKCAGLIAGQTALVTAALQNKLEKPADQFLFEKIIATYHACHPDGLEEFEQKILRHSAWNEFDKFFIKRVFACLKEAARDAEFDQSKKENAATWKNAMGALNEILIEDAANLQPYIATFNPALGSAVTAAVATVNGVRQLIETGEWAAGQAERAANIVLAAAGDLANEALQTAQQLELLTLGPKLNQVAAEEIFQPEPAIAAGPDPVPTATPLADTRLPADPERYYPFGARAQTIVEQARTTGAVLGISMYSHAHVASSALDKSLRQACDAALAQRKTQWLGIAAAGGHWISSEFLRQRQQIALAMPAATPASYSGLAWQMGKATLAYGMRMFSYRQNADELALQGQLQALLAASGGSEEVMREASHFLTHSFADACFRQPWECLGLAGQDGRLKLETSAGSLLVQMDGAGPRYAYTLEPIGGGKTALTVQASWQILAYGRNEPMQMPLDTSSSALRASVQVILRESVDEHGNGYVETAIYPLGISANIDNHIDFNMPQSA